MTTTKTVVVVAITSVSDVGCDDGSDDDDDDEEDGDDCGHEGDDGNGVDDDRDDDHGDVHVAIVSSRIHRTVYGTRTQCMVMAWCTSHGARLSTYNIVH